MRRASDRIMTGLAPADRRVLELRLQGHTHFEIAAETRRELPDRLRRARDPPDLRNPAVLADCDLAELQVNINTEIPQFPLPSTTSNSELEGAAGKRQIRIRALSPTR